MPAQCPPLRGTRHPERIVLDIGSSTMRSGSVSASSFSESRKPPFGMML
jgi:hypothetical protein